MNSKQLENLYELYCENPNIITDSRKIVDKSLFFALKGENFDGNRFVQFALESGASYVVMDNATLIPDGYEQKCFLVTDTLKTLQTLAAFHRSKLSIPLIGITGTNGKTTTKELLFSVLSRKFNVQATQGNLNNHIGVPLTLLSINREHEIAIVEMGANHFGEIKFLCEIAKPTHGIITNIGLAHIEGFGSFEGVIKTKFELFDFLAQTNGYAFVNNDDENIVKHIFAIANKTTYGIGNQADVNATVDENKAEASILYDDMCINSHLTGAFNAINILASLTIGKHFGIENHEIKTAIEEYQPANHRSQIKKTERNTLILDCYNANPSSVNAALKAFVNMKSTNKRVFLGAMKELGKDSKQEHKNIVDFLLSHNFLQVILVGNEYKEFCSASTKLLWFDTSSEACNYLLANPVSNSTILIKGSRATKMELLEDVL
ncbi:MAG: UDP-N-acetylmuramoyl-tripeptide--D-alanyl-D-alanine ligase [Bacteroidales bacterium]|jgi:UDP-N-acetylmuramoyl-tripeptide--D-alanyl-D-alanine ligase|nr:UDP-N-acetylmuramoyl-tripeptide--D-alanyl-D-alanine ligase [Bacteroidales bacterium]